MIVVVVIAVAGLLFWSANFNASHLASTLKSKLTSISFKHDSLQPIDEKSFLPEPLRYVGSGDNSLAAYSADVILTHKGVIRETNQERTKVGIGLLIENQKLDDAAEKKLKDLFEKQYFEHVSPTGIGPSDLAKQVGYEYIVVGENLALGNFKNDDLLVQAWMDSPGHRANILNARFTEIGTAVGKGVYEGKNVWMAVQSFGTPLSTCPSPEESLKVSIATNQTLLKDMEQDLASRKAEIDSEQDPAVRNEKVKEYNAKIAAYNALADKIKQQVATYNAQVSSFNSCING
jgi:hypothetical protein